MPINRKLDWFKHADEFGADEKRVLLALSFKEHRWRTMEDFRALTPLDHDELAAVLAKLLREDLIMGSFDSRAEEPVFGLVERNDPAYKKRHRAKVPHSSPK